MSNTPITGLTLVSGVSVNDRFVLDRGIGTFSLRGQVLIDSIGAQVSIAPSDLRVSDNGVIQTSSAMQINFVGFEVSTSGNFVTVSAIPTSAVAGSGTPLTIQVFGSTVATSVETISFNGFSVSVSGNVVNVSAVPASAVVGNVPLNIQSEGSTVATSVETINFVGFDVSASGTNVTASVLATPQITDASVVLAYNSVVPQVSAAEIAAGTETSVRRFSPADIVSFVSAFETPTNQTNIEIFSNSSSITANVSSLNFIGSGFSISNAGNDVIVSSRGPLTNQEVETAYNAQVPQVTSAELAAADTVTSVRRFSPADINAVTANEVVPAFFARQIANTSGEHAVFTSVEASAEIDQGGFYNASANAWVPPNGVYRISGQSRTSSRDVTSAGGGMRFTQVRIMLNNVEFARGPAFLPISDNAGYGTINILVSVNGTDQISFEVRAQTSAGAGRRFGMTPAETFFSGERV